MHCIPLQLNHVHGCGGGVKEELSVDAVDGGRRLLLVRETMRRGIRMPAVPPSVSTAFYSYRFLTQPQLMLFGKKGTEGRNIGRHAVCDVDSPWEHEDSLADSFDWCPRSELHRHQRIMPKRKATKLNTSIVRSTLLFWMITIVLMLYGGRISLLSLDQKIEAG